MSICLDCKTSSRQVCPVHAATDNTQDAADLEIARLKAELEELRAWNQKQQEAFYHLRTRVEVMDQLKDELAKARAQDVVARAELSRLTEANNDLRHALAMRDPKKNASDCNERKCGECSVCSARTLLSSGDSE